MAFPHELAKSLLLLSILICLLPTGTSLPNGRTPAAELSNTSSEWKAAADSVILGGRGNEQEEAEALAEKLPPPTITYTVDSDESGGTTTNTSESDAENDDGGKNATDSTTSSAKNSNSSTSSRYYSDSFVREKLFPLAAAAYGDQQEKCLNQSGLYSNATLYRRVNVSCDGVKSDVCAGFVAVSHDDSAIMLAFRGTDTFLQLLIESSETVMRSRVKSPIGGLVGEYFSKIFNKLWYNESLGEDVRSLITAYPDYSLWVSGHSLGGALAALAVAELAANSRYYFNNTSPAANSSYSISNCGREVKLATFGQPRTGDKDWADAFDSLFTNPSSSNSNNSSSNVTVDSSSGSCSSYRVTHRRDVVPHLPPRSLHKYTHYRAEAWYPKGMTTNDSYVVCVGEQESRRCADTIRHLFSVGDHLVYFGRDVSAWGEGGCAVDEEAKKKSKSWWRRLWKWLWGVKRRGRKGGAAASMSAEESSLKDEIVIM